MYVITMETECENCGGSAYMQQAGVENKVIIDFLEETPFRCKCGSNTYLEIEKRIEED
ncbi:MULTISPECIES: hypothetical protein [Oceanobacillus]|uniref:Uncharacterized protein n=1 Tax=Oceanobacillus indicireducens TaxID=1004261 RepID=A0A917Y353_9BACI|nr:MULTISPECIES: hypothetical protein [Oceanobacillus]MCF3942172.1 hypothetical protein [Oceanobacillus alkalisoli]MCG5104404.1 hypothetical protein [Oceanobacillus alkalisoli]GGN64553.1 hypothetical protein GCM10007971_32540 [Oceanobacillus indicireducens]